MTDRVLVKHIITAEVNPLQMSILMDTLSNSLPEIRLIFGDNSPKGFVVNFDDIEKTVNEIYSVCYSGIDLFEDAKRIFEETGSFPDIHSLLEANAKSTFHIPGPGEIKSLEFEITPAHVMLVYLLLRGYFNQFMEMMESNFSELVFLDFGVMQTSADAIYEASIALTDIREKAAPIVEIYKLTGQLPDGMNN